MASVLDIIKHYQKDIEKYSDDEGKVLRCIDKLRQLTVTVQHLQETGVGRTVNALRKEPGEVGQKARALVLKWKTMVAAEESDQEGDHRNDTSTHNGHGSGRESDDHSQQSRHMQDNNNSSKISTPRSDQKVHHREMNGHTSGSKRKYHSSEEEDHDDSKKKSRHTSSSEDDHRKQIVIKKEKLTDSEESDDESESSESDSDSYTSESSQEEIKVKKEIKEEKESIDKSSSHSSKHSHSHKNYSRKESSSTKRHDSSERDRHSHHKSSSKEISKKSSETSSKSSSHKHKSSHGKDNSSDKRHKSDTSSDEKKVSKSSSRHGSENHKSSSHRRESSYDKQKSSDKHSNKEKSSSHTDKVPEIHKSSSEKYTSKHKSKESSSSKEKHRSSSKEKPKERSSSKEISNHSHSSEKKHSSSDNKLQNMDKSKHKNREKSKEKSSSSSSHKSKSSSGSSKSKEDVPKKKSKLSNSEDSGEDGIDCGSGASFAEALGMISPTKPKKKSSQIRDSNSPNNSFSNDLSPAALLAPSVKLAPLPALEISALPEISPNYKPRAPTPLKFLPPFSDEDAISAGISSKNQRTKVYSGNKVIGKVTTLYEMCVQVLQEHIDALEYTGGVPYEILKPVVDRATPQQLFLLEHYNPYLMEDTDHLWQKFCEKNFRSKRRQELESWREMYMRCQEEQESKLKSLTANIKLTQEAKKAPIKQTKMAYVDSIVKPPRNVARKQALHGTAHTASASPASRVASLSTAPGLLKAGSPRPPPAASLPASSFNKPKKAPLMQKALQLMRGRKR